MFHISDTGTHISFSKWQTGSLVCPFSIMSGLNIVLLALNLCWRKKNAIRNKNAGLSKFLEKIPILQIHLDGRFSLSPCKKDGPQAATVETKMLPVPRAASQSPVALKWGVFNNFLPERSFHLRCWNLIDHNGFARKRRERWFGKALPLIQPGRP